MARYSVVAFDYRHWGDSDGHPRGWFSLSRQQSDWWAAVTFARLGPGFTAGRDCHAVVETMRGPQLGRVFCTGSAAPNTGTPGVIGGGGAERVLLAPAAGTISWRGPHRPAGASR